jgi:hypothetical protein
MTDKKPVENPQQALIKKKKEVAGFLESDSLKAAVAKVLPKHVTPERMMRIAQTAVMRKPELTEATHAKGGLY